MFLVSSQKVAFLKELLLTYASLFKCQKRHSNSLNFITNLLPNVYVSLQLLLQNAVSAQPCVGKFRISLVLMNFLHCNFRLWFKTP